GEAARNQVIAIEAGRVAGVEEAEQYHHIDSSELIDLSNVVILPVLIDSHVHLCMSGSIDQEFRKKQLEASYEELVPLVAEHLRHHFSHGILALRDGGDRSGTVLRYVREHHRAAENPVTVLSPGAAFHQGGRYGALIGSGVGGGEPLVAAFSRLQQKTKLIKVVNSGLNSLTEYGRETKPQFGLEELSELVSEARRRGCSVMVHANGRVPVKEAIEAGCDSIEHGFFMGRENIELMAEKGIFWVPTLFTMKACAMHADHYRTKIDRKVVEKTLAHQLEQLAYAREKGVLVALGTDSGSIGVLHGESLTEEMKLFRQAGFSLSETIRCATEHGARLLGIEDLGVISAGKPAHFLVTRGTPAQLPRKLGYLEAIYLDGRPSSLYRRTPDYTNLRKFEGVAFGGKVRY
ncbi:MAG: amidohydrolase family protein, partial [Desulfofustis sp.]